ncbi:CBS domain-containing protein CBSX6-like [Telopea speciosissima]|uniref:CBS domain-containing protein CBSX6-like n=1 Tax=Telopea speciosissima TaxID=54955 RepID=UPI001CC6A480|nr:CBS domain-containing protein CBSX6-like [Telopea speciosissima]
MASVFLYHVVGDLTIGKPDLIEFQEAETIESAVRAIGECTEGGIPVWRKRSQKSVVENAEMRQQRFVGIINSLDIVAFLAREDCLDDQEKALKTPVAEVVVPNNSLLKEVDPATRLIDALDLMKQGVMRLLVPKSVVWKGMSKRFSFLYSGKGIKNLEASGSSGSLPSNSPSTSSYHENRFCCLSREDVLRFIIGRLGTLAPLPLSSISALGAINPNYYHIDTSSPALEAAQKHPQDPSVVAVVECTSEGQHKIVGEISASRLWKCDYVAAAWSLANLTAGQFVMGVEDNGSPRALPDFLFNSQNGDNEGGGVVGNSPVRLRKFSSRSIGFFSNPTSPAVGAATGRNMYRGRSTPLMCKVTSSLAAVLAQMLSHRVTHVWVTEAGSEDLLVGAVGYIDILDAVTKHPTTVVSVAEAP